MKKTYNVCAAALTAALLLSGCGMYEKEYVSVKDYTPPMQESVQSDEKVTVRNFTTLKQALLDFAYNGDTAGIIVFDQSYDGDTTEDLASACWQVRTQDALCAYCIENIAYDINKIVTINEANIYISYSQYGVKAADIQRTYYSSGIERALKEALNEGKHRLAVLVSSSTNSAEDVAGFVTNIYRENPTITAAEPKASVTMFSGNARQRLYEINLSYSMTQDERGRRLAQLAEFSPFAQLETDNMSDADKAYAACEYLTQSCEISDSSNDNTAYAALIGGSADSEGLALAYVELCHRLGLDCRIVYGQHAWEDHCWNIVKADGSYYHVDITKTISGNYNEGMFADDEHFWGSYRWDVASYPKCQGTLNYELYQQQKENAKTE